MSRGLLNLNNSHQATFCIPNTNSFMTIFLSQYEDIKPNEFKNQNVS